VTAALNVRDYACGRVRRRLDSYLAGELSVDLSHEILEHLDRCPECRAELKARENLRAAVRRIAAAMPEPRDGFEAEVRARIARTPPRGTVSVLLLAASVLVAAGVASWLVVGRDGRQSPETTASAPSLQAATADFAVVNHEICALRHTWPETAPPEEVLASGLDPKLERVLREAIPRLPGYVPVTAHECAPAGETVFHIVFRRVGTAGPGGLVSVLSTRPGSKAASGPALAGLVSGGRRGLAVVGTSAPDGRLLLLVSGGNEDETMALGRAVLPALATAFAGG